MPITAEHLIGVLIIAIGPALIAIFGRRDDVHPR